MKRIVEIPDKVVEAIQNGEDYRYDIHTAIAQSTPITEGDLIMFRTLMTEIANKGLLFEEVLLLIDNAKTPTKGDCINRELLKKDIDAQISDFNELNKKGEPYKEFKDIRAILFGLFIGKNLIDNAQAVEGPKGEYVKGVVDTLDKAFLLFDAKSTYSGERVLQILEKLKWLEKLKAEKGSAE